LKIEHYENQKRERHNDLMTVAWYTVAFGLQKKMPKLKDYLVQPEPKNIPLNNLKDELIIVANKKNINGFW